MKPFHPTIDRHRECWDLLPWVANERVAARDLGWIEAHLQTCRECRLELEAQRRLRDAIRAEEPIVLAPQASFQKLMQRIDAAEEARDDAVDRDATVPPVRTSPTKKRAARVPRWLAIAACVQAVAIAALLGTIAWQSQQVMTAPRFSTLTTPSSAPEGPVIRIVFRDNVTVAEINALLHSLDANIVAGPSSAGVYTLQLDRSDARGTQVERIAAKLREDERVIFSEPAVAEMTAK